MLSVGTFGAMEVFAEGEAIALPASRKTRALLGYLLLSGAPQRRERLCELLWEVPDDPRGALRWSLSKLRSIINCDGVIRLQADRDRVAIDTTTIDVDFDRVQILSDDESADAAALADAWRTASPVLLDDCDLSNQPAFAAWLEHHRNEAVRMRIKLARRLAFSTDLVPEDRERWAERWLGDAPFDPAAARHLVSCRRRLGREHEAVALSQELTLAFVAAGLVAPNWSPEEEIGESDAPPVEIGSAEAPRQTIRFARSKDGASLAWASIGDRSNPPLVKAANWLTHLELDWEAPIWSPLYHELAKTYHVIRYDERGCGLSDWNVKDISFESFVTDLELVVDAAGLETFPLLGISQGAAVSIEYAARHPERVSRLILFGGYPVGWRHVATEDEIREREAIMVLTQTGWGRTDPSYRHLFSRTFMPTATPEELAWFDEFQRRTTSADNAVRFLEAFADIDVRERLKDVQAPTLVLHSRGDHRIPVATGRGLAARIPQAEFYGLDSDNHLLLGRELASRAFRDAIHRFLRD
ncbi:alpha/beta hydrolase [Hephaestia mangrovi]|uniref:alpha/beta hydrolase n=1 Tax=Hephaestia mangrovi TaxID=2873268 RepID=UPI001CA69C52|nr:alpha/beta hydrolase [Hephaestia mangrovi]MBY8828900.1 alpha/beta fold hydrolase [Hephaestia mangrovi]